MIRSSRVVRESEWNSILVRNGRFGNCVSRAKISFIFRPTVNSGSYVMPLSKSSMLAASVAGLAITVSFAGAQPYPSKAIRMVVPFPPGGPNDILGRLIAQRLTAQVGQQVVIDNRGGAGGIIGAELAARAVADGYTLLFGGTASLAINHSLHRKLPYYPLRDFASVSLVGTAPSLLTVHPSLPVKNVKDLIDLAKA